MRVDTFSVTMDETTSWKEHVFSSSGKEISSILARLGLLRRAPGNSYQSLIAQYLCYIYIIRWYYFYLTVVRSSGIGLARVLNPT